MFDELGKPAEKRSAGACVVVGGHTGLSSSSSGQSREGKGWPISLRQDPQPLPGGQQGAVPAAVAAKVHKYACCCCCCGAGAADIVTLGDSWMAPAIRQRLIQAIPSAETYRWERLGTSCVLTGPEGAGSGCGAIQQSSWQWVQRNTELAVGAEKYRAVGANEYPAGSGCREVQGTLTGYVSTCSHAVTRSSLCCNQHNASWMYEQLCRAGVVLCVLQVVAEAAQALAAAGAA